MHDKYLQKYYNQIKWYLVGEFVTQRTFGTKGLCL